MKDEYLTIDKDDLDEAEELLRLLRALGIEGEYRRSSSGDGMHIRIELHDELDKEDRVLLRWMLGDDFGRVAGDFRRMQHEIDRFEVLFYRKNGEDAGEWKNI